MVGAGLHCSMTKGPPAGAYSIVSAGQWTVALHSPGYGRNRPCFISQERVLGELSRFMDAGHPEQLNDTRAVRLFHVLPALSTVPEISRVLRRAHVSNPALGFTSMISNLVILSCEAIASHSAHRWQLPGAVTLLLQLFGRHVTPQLIYIIYILLPGWRC